MAEESSLPLISVIVPVYNVEPYLERCIESIVDQTYQNWQMILVDDGSMDQSGSICDRYAGKDDRIQVIHKTNGGLSDARNCGIEKADGQYIAFVDSDDFVQKDFLKVQYENLARAGADMAICSYQNYCSEQDMGCDTENHVCILQEDITSQLYLNPGVAIVAWNKLYRRELWNGVRYPAGRLHEDEAVIHELLTSCSKIVISDAKLYYYRQRAGSIMAEESDKSIEDAVYAYTSRIAFFGERHMPIDQGQAQRNLLLYLEKQFDMAEKTGNKKRAAYVRAQMQTSIKEENAFWRVLDKASIFEIYLIAYMPVLVGSYRRMIKELVRAKRSLSK